jgi:hypothetical protein
MERGRGQLRTTKSQRRKWVEEDLTTESVDTIKVRIQRNLNQRRKVFMNSQMLQYRGDKVNCFFHVDFEVKLFG